jgi:predicted restriction endonuclease
MEFTRGNLALLNHLESGKRIFFFESVGKGLVQYKSELELYDFDYQQGKDREGDDRQMIIFYFKKVGAQIQIGKPEKIYTQPTIVTLVTEKETTVKSRVGQGAYRTSLIYRWNSKCAVSGVGKQELLIASHIKSWKDSRVDERTDINNGLLLNPTYDALFDKHLISFEDSGKIILTSKVSDPDYEKLGVSKSDIIKNLSSGNKAYLEYHRGLISNQF